jgi:hypothetical protein
MSDVACFFIEPVFRAKRGLRRYASSAITSLPPCPGRLKFHDAIVWIDTIDAPLGDDGVLKYPEGATRVESWLTDCRWPETCAHCGYKFRPSDEMQIFTEPMYRRTDTGDVTTIRDAAPGAIWDAFWLADWEHYRGPDGRSLVCKLPNGHTWQIDGVASNCDAPCQDCGEPIHRHLAQPPSVPCRKLNPRPHKCWIRHGTPPLLTVDKNGATCNAGAGSILAGDYHGFLRNGRLVQA